jgi:hypothetical protein
MLTCSLSFGLGFRFCEFQFTVHSFFGNTYEKTKQCRQLVQDDNPSIDDDKQSDKQQVLYLMKSLVPPKSCFTSYHM